MDEAKSNAQNLAWQSANGCRDRAKLLGFLESYSDSPKCASARQQLADMDWLEAERAHAESVYLSFAENYPGDARASAARARAIAVRAHAVELAWISADRAHTRKAYESFLEKYPNAPHATEAEKGVANLDWEAAVRHDTVTAYVEFARENPDDPRVAAARRFWTRRIKRAGLFGRGIRDPNGKIVKVGETGPVGGRPEFEVVIREDGLTKKLWLDAVNCRGSGSDDELPPEMRAPAVKSKRKPVRHINAPDVFLEPGTYFPWELPGHHD